ncbi:hypothetical protein O3P69_018466 [Scylla paramamosain]|uniref:Uncharacterized protein n=1 Tax=Scylla paramamosain TaxID=85552 RepID=A0AAW0T2D4_SCYPA
MHLPTYPTRKRPAEGSSPSCVHTGHTAYTRLVTEGFLGLVLVPSEAKRKHAIIILGVSVCINASLIEMPQDSSAAVCDGASCLPHTADHC